MQIGDELPSITKEITQEKINRYAEASGDYNPIHVDPEFAQKTMFKGTIGHGLMTLAYLSEMMTRYLGEGWISGGNMEVTFLAPTRPDQRYTTRGKVTDKREEVSAQLVECEIWCEDAEGNKVVSGKAVGRVI
ncbi:MAG: MaoC family dehydratase [Candidatus Tectomicrobia bacterium]|uniref:MaoC family dehydratase n=1 Tax=Tectimicrobiota bacterium TaxID=2528274 RepID=A0A932CMJ6_UNCTE|nr:MaoC family dehydratase [Candidatus Tectomicrobia bacterium]